MVTMNYKTACTILEINNTEELNEKEIKKQYRRLALKYHPDKNISLDSHDKFNNIKDAYDYLMKYEGYNDLDENENDIDINDNIEKSSYGGFLMSFINIIVSEEYNDNIIIKKILNKVTSVCENKAYELLNNLDKIKLLKVYEIILKYKDVFNINQQLIEKIKDIIVEKSATDERIILNPSIDDLFEEKLYKLIHNEDIFYVPLWHNEVIYDISGNKLYVSCVPEISENMTIDDNNNIHIHIKYHISDIYNRNDIVIDVGKKQLPLNIENLHIKEFQTIKYANMGIPIAKSKDVYDTTKRGDIVLHITINFV